MFSLKNWRGFSLWIMVLVLSTLACNLTRQSDSDETATQAPVVDISGNPEDTVPPTVQIFTPQNGQQVVVGRPLDVRVNAQHPVGLQRIQMKVEDRIVSSKSLVENPTNVDVLLIWTPDREGSFTLEVQAFRGTTGSTPAQVNLQVFPEGAILSNPATGQQTPQPQGILNCAARITINNLNMRSGPSVDFSSSGTFSTGETVTVLGRNEDNRSREWYKVRRTNGQEVWVIRNPDWMEVQGNCDNLPTLVEN